MVDLPRSIREIPYGFPQSVPTAGHNRLPVYAAQMGNPVYFPLYV